MEEEGEEFDEEAEEPDVPKGTDIFHATEEQQKDLEMMLQMHETSDEESEQESKQEELTPYQLKR